MLQARASIDHLLKDGVPDWGAIDFDVHCGRCGYNLRTLTNPRCPECGLTFDWPAVLHRDGMRSEWLFEHNWRKVPLWSWCQTVCRAFWPRRFFKGLSLQDRVSPWALWVMFFSAIPLQILFQIVFATMILGPVEWLHSKLTNSMMTWGGPSNPVLNPGLRVEDHLEWAAQELELLTRGPFDVRGGGEATFVISIASIGTLVFSLVLIGILGHTLARCKVRSIQLHRVFAYAAPPVVVWWMLIGMLCFPCQALLKYLWTDDQVPDLNDLSQSSATT